VSLRAPFRSVEDNEWKKLALLQNPQLPLPSSTAIRKRLRTKVVSLESTLLDDIVPDSKVALSLDCWSSPTRLSFMAILVHFIDKDWQLHEKLIGFESLTDIHSGQGLATVVNDTIKRFHLEQRVMSITTDNASNNGTLVKELNTCLEDALNEKLILVGEKIQHIPCLAHVIQLALQALLGKIRVSPKNDVFLRDWQEQQELNDLESIATMEDRGVPYTLAKV
jgi:hypothetical protein